AFFINQFSGGDVNIPLVGCNVGIFFADFLADAQEFAVGGFNDVCFVDNRNAVFAVLACIFIGKARNTFCAFARCDNKVNGKVVVNVDALGADCVSTFGILAEERPVNAL